ncbi:hypothetical protein K788_0001295 (plasmid) [Paraburkholderia caribensis MBA4]|uniref:Uncharacterized protein n=1 Tax=Paraburkholderia caribensis MBA4 TaxID=1323664 RepID=A0A0P0RN17_9BURK|nr:hypothetical protein K788_0001295 [Paraburkholderia caribensis MBA4]
MRLAQRGERQVIRGRVDCDAPGRQPWSVYTAAFRAHSGHHL